MINKTYCKIILFKGTVCVISRGAFPIHNGTLNDDKDFLYLSDNW